MAASRKKFPVARSRLLLARSLMTAVRAATRPGSPSLAVRAGALPRLVRAMRSGEYRGMTLARLGLLGVAAAYILSPVDLMPEGFLAVFGLADDALVLSWLAAALITETDSFLDWESARSGAPAQGASGGSWPQDAPAEPSLGTGHIVR